MPLRQTKSVPVKKLKLSESSLKFMSALNSTLLYIKLEGMEGDVKPNDLMMKSWYKEPNRQDTINMMNESSQ